MSLSMTRGRKIYNLVLVTDCEKKRVLLGYKKRGFGAGIWSGFGGKVNPGEDIEASAKRELYEETSLSVTVIEKVGILCFDSDKYSDVHEAHVFKVTQFHGTPRESNEMKPQWFPIDSIPYHLLWQDFQFWWPYFQSNQLFSGFFMYKGLEYIIDYKLMIVNELNRLTPVTLTGESANNCLPSFSGCSSTSQLPIVHSNQAISD